MRLAIALGIVYVVWGSTYFAIAVANRTLPPMLMLSVLFLLVAGGPLYLWAMRRGETAGGHPGRRQWGAAAVIGGLLLVIDTGGVAWAEQRVASGLRHCSSRVSRSSWRSSIGRSSGRACRSAQQAASRPASSAS